MPEETKANEINNGDKGKEEPDGQTDQHQNPPRDTEETSGGKSDGQESKTGPTRHTGATVGDTLHQLLMGGSFNECPSWPPDAFALVASILEETGVYRHLVLGFWPPRDADLGSWREEIGDLGWYWWNEGKCPAQVNEWWKKLVQHADVTLDDLRAHVFKDSESSELSSSYQDSTEKKEKEEIVAHENELALLVEALLQISAVTDESCSNIGLHDFALGSEDVDQRKTSVYHKNMTPFFEDYYPAEKIVIDSNLCQNIDPALAKVLPKLLTPQVGLNLRSLTHNIALWKSSEVRPKWNYVLTKSDNEFDESITDETVSNTWTKALNVLFIPWPFEIGPSCFKAVEHSNLQMPNEYGFFSYQGDEPKRALFTSMVSALIDRSKDVLDHIDMVLFPELALTEKVYDHLARYLTEQEIVLVAGVSGKNSNTARCAYRKDPPQEPYESVKQPKHHRWKLDRSQITQYQLGSTLGTDCSWWEHIHIKNRTVNFFHYEEWLTFSVLICEDLARQDPVSSLIRAVGPNLVIALLMDGPQIPGRWSDRYASVLSDDPGSSVLSITSIGMANRSKPRELWGKESDQQNVVGLWRDSTDGHTKIRIEPDSAAVALSINVVKELQFSADGRQAADARCVPVLSGVHQIKGTRTLRSDFP